MTVQVTIHPPFWRLLKVLGVTAGAVLLIMLPLRIWGSDRPPAEAGGVTRAPALALGNSDPSLLVATLSLAVDDPSLEASWNRALTSALGGQSEVAVRQGRIDVLTSEYAIEIDRIEKWHESIGQSLHYAVETGKRPAVALFWPHAEWPPDRATAATIAECDRVCQEQKIKVIVLRLKQP